MTQTEEILSIIRYAPGPIGAAGIYEQCKGIERMSDVSSLLSQLFSAGKVDRVEITTDKNRRSYAYMLKKVPPAPAPEAETAAAETAAPEAAPARVRKPRAARVQAHEPARAPRPADAAHAADLRESAMPAADPASIADGMLARLKRALPTQLAGDFEITTAPGSITVNVERVEIHISIGVAA